MIDMTRREMKLETRRLRGRVGRDRGGNHLAQHHDYAQLCQGRWRPRQKKKQQQQQLRRRNLALPQQCLRCPRLLPGRREARDPGDAKHDARPSAAGRLMQAMWSVPDRSVQMERAENRSSHPRRLRLRQGPPGQPWDRKRRGYC